MPDFSDAPEWLHGYLGDAITDTTPEQRAAIIAASDAITGRWPDPDLGDVRQSAMTGAVQVILGDVADTELVSAWRTTVEAELHARAAMTGAIIAAARTESELSLTTRLGVTRPTIRKALGKG